MRLLMLVLSLCSGCASLSPVFFVDSDFAADENTGIQQAADAWSVASNGALAVHLVFGVPIDPSYGSAWGRRTIVRVTQAEIDTNFETAGIVGKAIGTTIPGDRLEMIAIVPSRLGPYSFRAVVAHELGHHFMDGGQHSDVPAALMYGEPYEGTTPRAPDEDRFVRWQCLSRPDYVLLSRSAGIDVGGMRMCP